MMKKRTFSKSGANLSFFSQPDSQSSKSNQTLLYETEFSLQFTSDALEFYKHIYDHKALQKVEILNVDRNHAQGFTNYLIQVDTIHLSYQIWKRYSDFYGWFRLVHKYLDPQTVENFPPKRYINNQSSSFLMQRQQSLNDFIMSFISNQQPYLVSFAFLDFIEVKRQYIIHQIKLIGHQPNNLLEKKVNPDEEQILEFVEQMNSGMENLTQTFNEIQSFVVKQKPRLTNESITALFQGCKQFNGLIVTIGQIDNEENGSHLICSAGLKLIYSLLDYEINRDAETFIRVFTQLPIKTIHQLQLSNHIRPDHLKPCKQYAFRILEIYTSKNNIRQNELVLKLLQDNQQAQEQYSKWLNQKQLHSF